MHTIATCDEQNVMNKNISFHTRQHIQKQTLFYIFLMGIWLENVTLKLLRSISKLFISDSNALKCLLGQQLHMQLDLWNSCQPTCHWQLHAWYQNKTHCSTYHSKQILDNKIHNLTDWSTKVSINCIHVRH